MFRLVESMINVLHFYKVYYPDSYGGVEQVIYQLSEGCSELGVNSTVHTLSKIRAHSVEQYENHQVVKSKSNVEIASTPFSFTAISDFKSLAERADVIHYHFPYPYMDMLHFLCDINKPTVVTYHSDILKQKYWLKLYKPLMMRFLDAVDVIVATSPNYVKSSEVLKSFKSKTRIIPIGIEPGNYSLSSNYSDKTIEEKLPERFFLFIGALRYYKGLDTLIAAVTNTQLPLVIVGSGPLEDELKQKIKAKNLNNVVMLGSVDNNDKNLLLDRCYAIVFPSHLRTEAFGITLLEGALFGKPLISCEIGTGTTYVNIHDETGLVIPPNDHNSLANAMEYLLENPQKAKQYGENSKKRFDAFFTAKQMNKSYFEIYKSLAHKF